MVDRIPYLPAIEVRYELVRGMQRCQMDMSQVGDVAFGNPKHGACRQLIAGRSPRISSDTAERLLRAVDRELNHCPSWVLGTLETKMGNPLHWEHILGA